MHWTGWIVVAFTILNAGWMLFDGVRALTVGDYLTPQTGEYAGQLGPWSRLVKAVGIDPRSTGMKSTFVVYGVVMLVLTGCFVLRLPWAWWGMMIAAALGLWYLPVGTILNPVVIVLLWLPPLRQS